MPTPNKEAPTAFTVPTRVPNPRRVAAGRLNRMKRKGLTPEGYERLRQTALRNQPWRFSTGPRTPKGKAKVAQNGKKRQLGPRSESLQCPRSSVREIRRQFVDLCRLLDDMRVTRQEVDR